MHKLNWVKQGRIFSPETIIDWGFQYSQVPWAIELNDILRIYFTSRSSADNNGQFISRVFYADFQKDNLSNMIGLAKNPAIELGALGAFDEFGTMPCSVIKRDELNEIWLYYVGWNRKVSVPYDCAIGLAKSIDGGATFIKISKGPLIGATKENPFLLGCPRVYNFNQKWYMWYLAGTDWLNNGTKPEAIYHLKLATSDDGIKWRLVSENVVPKKYEDECQTCACVFEHNGFFHLYFTYRYGLDFRNPERGYRIGYAYSSDLINWKREDELGGVDVSEAGWDSEMVCYPSIMDIAGKKIMFYCGNYFGKTGFGYAILKS